MRHSYFTLLSIAALATCATDGGGGTGITTSDSAGVTIVEHDPRAWSKAVHWRLSDAPLAEIGGSDSIGAYNLFRVTSVSRLSNGDIIIANDATQEIRIFDASGRHLRTAGGRGSGPGEFQTLPLVQVIRGDSIAAFDGREGRITIFDHLGEVARTVRVAAGYVRHILRDGASVTTVAAWPDFKPGVIRESVILLHVSQTGSLIDTIGRFPGSEFYEQQGARYLEYRPFGKRFETAVGDSLVYVGTGDRYEIRGISRDGTLRMLIRAQVPPERITPKRIDSRIARRIAMSSDPQRQEDLRRLRRIDDAFPKAMPAHGSLRAGVGGELWVQDYQADLDSPSRWRAFGPGGKLLATIDTPQSFSIMSIGIDWVAGVWRDALDVEHVRLYELIKP